MRRILNQDEAQRYLLEAAIEATNESVLITTPHLEPPGPEIVFVNHGFTRMTGYLAAEVLGKTPRILQGPNTDRVVLARLRRELTAGQTFSGTVINYRKEGSEFWLEWTVAPVYDDEGRLTHWMAIQRDVTARKAAEAKLQRLNTELQHRLKQGIALRAIELAMTGSHNLKFTLEVVLSQVMLMLGVDAAAVLLLNHANQELETVASRGFRSPSTGSTRLRLGE